MFFVVNSTFLIPELRNNYPKFKKKKKNTQTVSSITNLCLSCIGKTHCNIAAVMLVMLYNDARRSEVSGGGRDIFG